MKHPVKWLIALNVLTLGITLLMFSAGLLSVFLLKKSEKTLSGRNSAAEVSTRLEKYIGRPYTEKLHDYQSEVLKSTEDALLMQLSMNQQFSGVMFQMGGILAVIGLANFFLLWKMKRVYDAVKSLPPA